MDWLELEERYDDYELENEHFSAMLEKHFSERIKQDEQFRARLWWTLSNSFWVHEGLQVCVDFGMRDNAQIIDEIAGIKDSCYTEYMLLSGFADEPRIDEVIKSAIERDGWKLAQKEDEKFK